MVLRECSLHVFEEPLVGSQSPDPEHRAQVAATAEDRRPVFSQAFPGILPGEGTRLLPFHPQVRGIDRHFARPLFPGFLPRAFRSGRLQHQSFGHGDRLLGGLAHDPQPEVFRGKIPQPLVSHKPRRSAVPIGGKSERRTGVQDGVGIGRSHSRAAAFQSTRSRRGYSPRGLPVRAHRQTRENTRPAVGGSSKAWARRVRAGGRQRSPGLQKARYSPWAPFQTALTALAHDPQGRGSGCQNRSNFNRADRCAPDSVAGCRSHGVRFCG